MNTGLSYEMFYDVLSNLREEFHTSGRFDDANVKLDEIIKLLLIGYHEAQQGNLFNLEFVRKTSKEVFNDEFESARALQYLFEKILTDSKFLNVDGTSIFGAHPVLNIQPTENVFADKVITEIGKIDFASLLREGGYNDFDLINECFGHFVRDNFRNNKEDAQYMTPQEVVQPVLDMVFHDLVNDAEFMGNILNSDYNLKIMDPTCGVGTLLIELLKRFLHYISALDIKPEHKARLINQLLNESAIGQDKVDRMVRLSKINMMFLGGDFSKIFIGNSIIGESKIDAFQNAIDMIITNPPFGALCDVASLNDQVKYPIINKLTINTGTVDSELALLDRGISLLRPGGRMIIVLPDSVVSAKGIYQEFRKELLKHVTIKAVIELPAVTFAQAGTRTKTVILYLQKSKALNTRIFMGGCEEVGYIVKERMGTTIKIKQGHNQMEGIARAYIQKDEMSLLHDFDVISDTPSATYITEDTIINDVLNPSFYSSERLKSLITLNDLQNKDYELKKLGEIALIQTKERKSHHTSETIKHISILHINCDGTIDFEKVEEFTPVCKGRECEKNDVLFSKINPRIPRVAVVPEYTNRLICSNEFEILVPKDDISPYLLSLLLNLKPVRQQIENFTSGTSSSHNRIKTEQLEEIYIPLPNRESKEWQKLSMIAASLEKAMEMKYHAEKIRIEQAILLEKMLLIG